MRVTTTGVGPHQAPLTSYILDASEEMASARQRPAVLILPGGGYAFTSDREAEPVAMAYLAAGLNAFVLRYSTGPGTTFPQALADARAALAWIRQGAAEMDTDPARIAAVGFSAGGHLAAALGTLGPTRPDALVLGYPVTLAGLGAAMDRDIPDIPAAVTSSTPPTFLFSTFSDTVVPVSHSLRLLQAMAARGVPFETHISLLGPHGLSVARDHTARGRADLEMSEVAAWVEDSVRFLRRVLGGFPLEGRAESFTGLRARMPAGLAKPAGLLLEDERAPEILDRHLPGALERIRSDFELLVMPLEEALERAGLVGAGTDLTALEADLMSLNG
ncbi:alpha/beta hydrolase [Actinomyces bowdenii]|uniref:alpha/beta hydrolase n=1 Tax=Actinomyces bowdenii TaxID=131109 RepID=UPI00163AFDD9|nr:alpha/beta hydrolase [Actinomyces bowdenii]